MNWLYVLFHPKRTIKNIKRLEERIEKLDFYLYGNRDWEVKKENDSIKAICPCMTEATEITGINKNKDKRFINTEYICPRCNKSLFIPKFNKEWRSLWLNEDEFPKE